MRFRNAIVRTPGRNFADGITSASLGIPSFEKAITQHDGYCQALRGAGLEVTVLKPDLGYPDAHFVEDTAVIVGERAMLTRPGAASRRGEVAAIRGPLMKHLGDIDEIVDPGTLDGGDVCEAGDRFYIGLSHRTNRAGAEQLATWLAAGAKSATFVDIRDLDSILHLKSGVSYLGEGRFVAIDALLPRLRLADDAVVRTEDAEEYAANCVRVNDVVLLPSGNPRLEEALAAKGFSTQALDMSEFRKMDGGLSCLSLRF